MKRTLSLLLFAALAFAQKRAITHEDIYLMKRTGEPVVSPDGRQIVFSLTEPDYDAAKQTSDLWLVAADGSAPRAPPHFHQGGRKRRRLVARRPLARLHHAPRRRRSRPSLRPAA